MILIFILNFVEDSNVIQCDSVINISDIEDNAALQDFVDQETEDQDMEVNDNSQIRCCNLFTWRDLEGKGYKRDTFIFNEQNKRNFTKTPGSMFDIFSVLLPNKIFEHMVTETNRYAKQFFESNSSVKLSSRYKFWLKYLWKK